MPKFNSNKNGEQKFLMCFDFSQGKKISSRNAGDGPEK
jgi:hypothetical protein